VIDKIYINNKIPIKLPPQIPRAFSKRAGGTFLWEGTINI